MATSAALQVSPTTSLSGYRGLHDGETILVCGCGESLNLLEHPVRVITIGVNDVGRRFTPDYLVVVNPRSQFTGDRFRYVESSRAKALFTQLDLGVPHPNIVRFKLGTYGGTQPGDADALHYTRNSPYVALCLAIHMGAHRIGLIGVDFTDNHFFGPTGTHSLSRRLAQIDAEYARLAESCRARGIELVNLSPVSRLTGVPRRSLHDFLLSDATTPAQPARESLRIVSYATSPVAGVPVVLARCIAARTAHHARCVWAARGYGNGVSFDGDVEWSADPRAAATALEAADVVVVHNGKVDPAHAGLMAGKRVVTLAHNYMWNVDRSFVDRGMPGLVVGQYQATLPEFSDWTVVPNPVPIWEPAYASAAKPDSVTVCYTPMGRHERYPAGHRLYWHGKGYRSTMHVLERLARELPVHLEVIRDRQVSHAESLAMKRRAHIVIDECVTGSYHRNSLEGLAAGCVVINGVGLLPGVAECMRRCAPDADRIPFTLASLETLERVLRELIERGPSTLAEDGRANRAWMEQHWDFQRQWQRFWKPVIEADTPAVTNRHSRTNTQSLHAVKEVIPMSALASDKVSVIIPHGGSERLPQLIATLVTLRQRQGVGEVIVVEMGEAPVAHAVAARWADKHVFVEHEGPFERARALNAGSAVAEYDVLLWHDNDILVPPRFIAQAVSELAERGLDFLFPYTSVRYLSEDDSRMVLRGERGPEDCVPVTTLTSSGAGAACPGCLGLVRRDFVSRHGGYIEGFRGWGGEDNAWNHKAALLGRAAATARRDMQVFHVHHPTSGGYGFENASAHNPNYDENVALLRRIWSVREPERLAREFPATVGAAGKVSRFATTSHVPSAETLPVWAYWEGPCPDWIRACRRTLMAHAPGLRLLTPDSFAQLRDRDRDIDLNRLNVVHRSDYIRAFLLHRYGGLWVDLDCLVMQSLQPIIDKLGQHDFIGHRERVGLVSNAFIGARPGSRIAAALYHRICATLRRRTRLQWNSLGADALTAIIAEDGSGWMELPCERVQPVCWSRPDAFFAARTPAEHEASFDPQAICYMLSNVTLNNWLDRHGPANLMGERTFFTFLLNRALGNRSGEAGAEWESVFESHSTLFRQQRCESISGPGSSLEQTRELRERLPVLLEDLGVRSLVDAPCGDMNWMRHIRLGVDRYTGVDLLWNIIEGNAQQCASQVRTFLCADATRAALPKADAIFCRDFLVHLPASEILRAIDNFKRSGATYLLTTTFTGPRAAMDIVLGGWRPLNLTLPPFNFPPPLRLINEKCTEGGGAFGDKSIGVWKLSDLPTRGA